LLVGGNSARAGRACHSSSPLLAPRVLLVHRGTNYLIGHKQCRINIPNNPGRAPASLPQTCNNQNQFHKCRAPSGLIISPRGPVKIPANGDRGHVVQRSPLLAGSSSSVMGGRRTPPPPANLPWLKDTVRLGRSAVFVLLKHLQIGAPEQPLHRMNLSERSPAPSVLSFFLRRG